MWCLMKNKILILMVIAAIFLVNPVFAMDSDEDGNKSPHANSTLLKTHDDCQNCSYSIIREKFKFFGSLYPKLLQTLEENKNLPNSILLGLKQFNITEDKIYCIHIAESEQAIREQARIANFPVNTISEVKAVIDPTTGTSKP